MSWAWRCRPIILTIWGAEVEGLKFQGLSWLQNEFKVNMDNLARPYLKIENGLGIQFSSRPMGLIPCTENQTRPNQKIIHKFLL